MYSAFCQRIQSAAAYIITVSRNRHCHFVSLKGATGQVHTLSAHLDCNISHDRYRPDALKSTKQLRLSILPKDTNTFIWDLIGYLRPFSAFDTLFIQHLRPCSLFEALFSIWDPFYSPFETVLVIWDPFQHLTPFGGLGRPYYRRT